MKEYNRQEMVTFIQDRQKVEAGTLTKERFMQRHAAYVEDRPHLVEMYSPISLDRINSALVTFRKTYSMPARQIELGREEWAELLLIKSNEEDALSLLNRLGLKLKLLENVGSKFLLR